MFEYSFWITGSSRSGKTTRLVTYFCQWIERRMGSLGHNLSAETTKLYRGRTQTPPILIFAANDDNRRDFADRLTAAIQGCYPVLAKTPLGFFQDEVILFWPLLIEQLDIKAQFPLRLRPETEQDLATKIWHSRVDENILQLPGTSEYTKIRRLLDLLQLAALSGTPIEDIASILKEGMPEQEGTPELWDSMEQMLLEWRGWCLKQGLLTYGIICELYWRYLLPEPRYQQHLQRRYQAILADDVDEYPAIARNLFDFLLNRGTLGAFTYNRDGQVRLGLNADPNYLAGLASRCQLETLPDSVTSSVADELTEMVVPSLVAPQELTIGYEPALTSSLPASLLSIQTTSRAQLLQQTAQVIINAVKSGQVQPAEIAVIAPGLDAIGRYTLMEILISQGIAVEPLNDQRPLISSPMVRALLSLLALVYPGLGRLLDREAIAEMLVVLSTKQEVFVENSAQPEPSAPCIDAVRAGLLSDYCYVPDPQQPRLLPMESFERWDRIGHRAAVAYSEIVQWLEVQREQQQQRLIPSVLAILDRAIQKFLWNGSHLPYDQLAAIRELMETAQHYWEVDRRLRQIPREDEGERGRGEEGDTLAGYKILPIARNAPAHNTIAQFIEMLRRGTVTANPYPVRRLPRAAQQAVTLATIFQYRAAKGCHRWHFWLDAGSPLWSRGGAAALFGAPLFLQEWSGRPWTEEDKTNADRQRLQRILRDLLRRAQERVYLCHSDLAINGSDQDGPLLALVNAAVPLTGEFALGSGSSQNSRK
ncbi:MAG: recombinase family protein [Symploca sp. SIO2B6]|nr:recombinase family protein [Symploca sp. SIO2B6]